MIQETIASLVSAPCGHSELGAAASASLISVPSQTSAATGTTCESQGAPTDTSGPGPGSGSGPGGGAASEAPTEATLDVRSVLSGPRLDENERQLAEELRPGSPTAWLVDVSQGQQRVSEGAAEGEGRGGRG